MSCYIRTLATYLPLPVAAATLAMASCAMALSITVVANAAGEVISRLSRSSLHASSLCTIPGGWSQQSPAWNVNTSEPPPTPSTWNSNCLVGATTSPRWIRQDFGMEKMIVDVVHDTGCLHPTLEDKVHLEVDAVRVEPCCVLGGRLAHLDLARVCPAF